MDVILKNCIHYLSISLRRCNEKPVNIKMLLKLQN